MPNNAHSIHAGKNAPNNSKDDAPAMEHPLNNTDARNRIVRVKGDGCAMQFQMSAALVQISLLAVLPRRHARCFRVSLFLYSGLSLRLTIFTRGSRAGLARILVRRVALKAELTVPKLSKFLFGALIRNDLRIFGRVHWLGCGAAM